jgi:hypothetical protein
MASFDFLSKLRGRMQRLFGDVTSGIKNSVKPLEVASPKGPNYASDMPGDPSINYEGPGPRPTNPVPTSTPTAMPTVTPTPTSVPTSSQLPSGTGTAMDYITAKTPPGMSLEQAFPALSNEDFMTAIVEADRQRQGLSNLLLLQGFFESTLGRNTPNIFGVKPGGESQGFASPMDALEYQLSPSVLGGGANPNMDILSSQEPLTRDDITNLYRSYDPPGLYLNNLLSALGVMAE